MCSHVHNILEGYIAANERRGVKGKMRTREREVRSSTLLTNSSIITLSAQLQVLFVVKMKLIHLKCTTLLEGIANHAQLLRSPGGSNK